MPEVLCAPYTEIRSDVSAIDYRSNVRWRRAIKALECPVEIRQIAKTGLERDPRDTTVGPASIRQHAMRAHEPAVEDELREGRSFAFEELADVAVRNFLPSGNGARRKVVMGEMRFDVALDGAQPRSADAPSFG